MRVPRVTFVVIGLGLALAGCTTPLSQAASTQSSTAVPTSATPTPQQVDREFLTGMVPHHQMAVEMARAEVQKGKRPEVKQLAQQIITAQQSEIRQLQQIAQRDYNFSPSTTMPPHAGFGVLMGEPILMNDADMMAQLNAASDTDRAFLQMMIPHHAIALVMADNQIRYGSDPRIKSISQSIVASQAKEIGQMESMLPSS